MVGFCAGIGWEMLGSDMAARARVWCVVARFWFPQGLCSHCGRIFVTCPLNFAFFEMLGIGSAYEVRLVFGQGLLQGWVGGRTSRLQECCW